MSAVTLTHPPLRDHTQSSLHRCLWNLGTLLQSHIIFSFPLGKASTSSFPQAFEIPHLFIHWTLHLPGSLSLLATLLINLLDTRFPGRCIVGMYYTAQATVYVGILYSYVVVGYLEGHVSSNYFSFKMFLFFKKKCHAFRHFLPLISCHFYFIPPELLAKGSGQKNPYSTWSKCNEDSRFAGSNTGLRWGKMCSFLRRRKAKAGAWKERGSHVAGRSAGLLDRK